MSELAFTNQRVWGRLCMSNWPQLLASRFNSVLVNVAGLRRPTKKQGGGWGGDDFVRLFKSVFPQTLLGWFWPLLWALFSNYGTLCIGPLTYLHSATRQWPSRSRDRAQGSLEIWRFLEMKDDVNSTGCPHQSYPVLGACYSEWETLYYKALILGTQKTCFRNK